MSKGRLFVIGTIVLLALLIYGLSGIRPAVAGGSATIQRANVSWHAQSGSGTVPGAWAQLVRNDNGFSATFHAKQLIPGHVYTLWLAIVNNPAACVTSPCSATDIITNNETVGSNVTYGGGHVAGASGNGSIGSHLSAGALPDGWFGNDFTNPRGAEIHLVLNDHGPAIADLLSNMLHSYRGGCTDESLPGIFPDTAKADGIPGPNTCRLYQVAIFQP